jgi:hypothetical protein
MVLKSNMWCYVGWIRYELFSFVFLAVRMLEDNTTYRPLVPWLSREYVSNTIFTHDLKYSKIERVRSSEHRI